jgi:hypothetical protein
MLRLRAYTRAQQSVEASISEQRSQLQRIDSHA